MTSFIITSLEETPQFLDDGESGVVAETGMLMVTGGGGGIGPPVIGGGENAIEGVGTNSLTIAGYLVTRGGFARYGDAYNFEGEATSVTITKTGDISVLGSAVNAQIASFASVFNDGDLETVETAIQISVLQSPLFYAGPYPGPIIEINNQGSMMSYAGGINLEVTASTAATIRNSGEIHAGHLAISVEVMRSGPSMSGPDDESLGALKLFNSGSISATSGMAILTGSGEDRVFNAGFIEGDVNLAQGADLYNGTDGQVVGRVLGRNGDDVLKGGDVSDDLIGGGGHDRLEGRGGDDVLDGRRGRDKLLGEEGDDMLFGGKGADRLNGGAGNDALSGGAGRDRFIFGREAGDDSVTGFSNGMDLIDLRDFGFRAGDFETVLAAVSKEDRRTILIDLDQLGGDGSVEVTGLKYGQVDASDFLL